MYIKTTRNVKVIAAPTYLEKQSEPGNNQYVWAYTIQLENLGAETVQLISRHWRITDGRGQTQEVRGEGVVGEQPVLKPGEKYQYTSGASLTTPSGIMVGSYHMVSKSSGGDFEIAIPAFSLDSPYQVVRPN